MFFKQFFIYFISFIFIFSYLTNIRKATAGISFSENKQEKMSEEKGIEKGTEDVAVGELLKILEEKTELATKTKMNIDFVPGMVSVLHGKDLLARGARTVYEALELIPGVDKWISVDGTKLFQIRGLHEVKYMLNGISINTTSNQFISTLLIIPLEQVDRIEVIRGPGSALYGEFAYGGVINVITKENGNALFGSYGSFDTKTAGGIFTYQKSEKEFKVSLNVGGMWSDGGNVQAGRDILYVLGQSEISNAPGPTNEKEQNRAAVFKLDFKGFSLTGQFLENRLGDYFGYWYSLPPDKKRLVFQERYGGLEAMQTFQIGDHFSTKVKLGWSEFLYQTEPMIFYPPGFISDGVVYTQGIIESEHLRERKFYGGLDLRYKGFKKHDLLMGMEFASISLWDLWVEANFDPRTWLPLPRYRRFTGEELGMPEGTKRNIFSVFLQDQFSVAEKFMVTGGLRYDYYNDVGSRLTPRLGVSYHLTDRQIIKFQYAEAFRPPTIGEIYYWKYPGRDIKPETIRTFELAYIYNSGPTIFRSTLFYSLLKNQLYTDEELFVDTRNATLKGFELEFIQHLTRWAKLNLNLSYVDARDKETHEKLEDIVDFMGNAGLIIQPWINTSLAFQYRYVGKRSRYPEDYRTRLNDYHTMDLTASVFHLPVKGMTIRCGVKNLLNADVVFPAHPYTYLDDYPRPGRQWWLALSYEF